MVVSLNFLISRLCHYMENITHPKNITVILRTSLWHRSEDIAHRRNIALTVDIAYSSRHRTYRKSNRGADKKMSFAVESSLVEGGWLR